MNTPRPDGVDQEWWNRKTEERARSYCPTCEPDVDPVRECVVVSHCRDHDPLLQDRLGGTADPFVKAPPVSPVAADACDEGGPP